MLFFFDHSAHEEGEMCYKPTQDPTCIHVRIHLLEHMVVFYPMERRACFIF